MESVLLDATGRRRSPARVPGYHRGRPPRNEGDRDRSRGALLVRPGKGGRRREVGMDRWAWEQLESWLELRRQLPIGALLCVMVRA
jgi:hypothetical protein